jgi:hypothetical protein
MNRLVFVVTGYLALGTVNLMADEPGERHRKGHRSDRGHDVQQQVTIVFSTGDVRTIREYYAPRSRRLPPGLQKKYARTGTLPPGWQKKMEPFPATLERRLLVLPAGYQRGVIDGHAVICNPRGVIFDTTVIF